MSLGMIGERVLGASMMILAPCLVAFLILVVVPKRGIGFLVSSPDVFLDVTLGPVLTFVVGSMMWSVSMRRMVGPAGFRPNRMKTRDLYRRGFRSVVPWEDLKLVAVLQVDQGEPDDEDEAEPTRSSKEKVVWAIEVFASARESYMFGLKPYSDELDFSLALLQTFAARGGEVRLPDHSADEDEWKNRWDIYSRAPLLGENIAGILDRVRHQVEDYNSERADAEA